MATMNHPIFWSPIEGNGPWWVNVRPTSDGGYYTGALWFYRPHARETPKGTLYRIKITRRKEG